MNFYTNVTNFKAVEVVYTEHHPIKNVYAALLMVLRERSFFNLYEYKLSWFSHNNSEKGPV